ncbi:MULTISPECIES: TniQ family protein [unclassified Psychrobacter]|uniref:TniQ family protein n=1 Tax=unclassified Psychrobacter TaxID=196806 RepID=UPI00178802F0|nr:MULTISPECIES: TniQ family protein [unclassified Psychrobacter]MBE0442125.1 TniQ family protein [Psychrobacter sp. FME13]
MAKINQSVTQNYRIRPLTFSTPLLEGESLTSWLIRAALRQGCSPLTFTHYYWPEHRIWTYDVDKGFKYINSQIHSDIAVLAVTAIDAINNQTLINFSKILSIESSSKVALLWTQPLSKRNRYSRIGYPYCYECMTNNKEAHLKLQWRFTWSVCCIEHRKFLQVDCPYCNLPYQPQLIEPEQEFINQCHSCHHKLDKTTLDTIPSEVVYKFQLLANQVLYSKQGTILGKVVDIAEWFDYLLFLINLVRQALKNPDYMFGKLLLELGIDLSELSSPKTSLRFDFLPLEERIVLIEHAYYLLQVECDDWIYYCQELDITQNSFQWSKRTIVPKAFSQVYDQLPKVPSREYKKQSSGIHPASLEAVMAAWSRLQRKIEMRESYDKHLKKE